MPRTKSRKSKKSRSSIQSNPQPTQFTVREPLKFLQICQGRVEKLANVQGNTTPNPESYYAPDISPEQLTLHRIFLQLISSAANANMLRNVINIHGQNSTRKNAILDLLTSSTCTPLWDYNQLLSDTLFRPYLELFSKLDIETNIVKLQEHKLIKENSTPNYLNILWSRWLTSVKDSAQFLLNYQTGEEFSNKISGWIRSVPAELRFAIPMYIASHIHGIGFALACDALKEMGFCEFAKPDVHICNVFFELGIAQQSNSTLNNQLLVLESFYKLVGDINQNSQGKKITPYALDKMIWLCCTGNFHKDNDGKVSRKQNLRNELITLMKQSCEIK